MKKFNHKSSKKLNPLEISLIAGLFIILIISALFIAFKSPFALAGNKSKVLVGVKYPSSNSLKISSTTHGAEVSNNSLNTDSKPAVQIKLPILLYHKTPDNFDEQMKHLKDTGYTTVTMQEATDIISGKAKGPAKPVAITFDDGFSDQLRAIDILKKYNFKSTFYIIVGGQSSDYCIGANKKNGGCGDSYLSWDEIKRISDSGTVEIGSHTIDHLQLSALDEASQKFQIFESKKTLEEKLGKPITSFAYPYGKFNQVSINLIRQAGYSNATTVAASEYQTPEGILVLNRIRDTKDLR
jgi:peptidoglycan/xylan/chitin deacetylase (PgdA/CDA1 family)